MHWERRVADLYRRSIKNRDHFCKHEIGNSGIANVNGGQTSSFLDNLHARSRTVIVERTTTAPPFPP
jgi:hypothetical protein